MKKTLVLFLLVLALALLQTVPAKANIVNVEITNSNGGYWGTDGGAGIGITDPGSTSNLFYNVSPSSSAALPTGGIASGTYLAFLGYEYDWPTGTAQLIIKYGDGTSKSATFQAGDIHASGDWTRVSGDTLYFGGGGFNDTPDRVGTYGSNELTPGNSVPDVVLMFSDSGPLPASSVPEPTALLLLVPVFLGLAATKRQLQI